LAADVNIACPPEVLGEIVVQLPTLAISEDGLTTQATKKRIYVQPSAREAWISYLEDNPRSSNPSIFSIHDCLDGRISPSDEHDPSSLDLLANDGINILGTPYGSPEFVEEYLQNKQGKHEQLLSFITYVSMMGFSRESHKMLIGSICSPSTNPHREISAKGCNFD
jgi:hypothetical protein